MRAFYRFFGKATLSVAAVMVAAATANAQQAAAPNGPTAPEGWFKICQTDPQSNKEVCALNIRADDEEGKPIASIRVIEFEGRSEKQLAIAVAPGLLLQPGMRILVDGEATGTAKFIVCAPGLCRAEAVFDSNFISSMKRGNRLSIIGLTPEGKQKNFPVTLSGFTAAYDGPPVDPDFLTSNNTTLQERLQKKAEEARKRLQEEQQ